MKLKNVSGRSRTVAGVGVTVGPDETFEVDDDLGKRLCEQPDNWQPVKAAKKGDD